EKTGKQGCCCLRRWYHWSCNCKSLCQGRCKGFL
ncbi:MAG: hypothetical protein AVDCRST_MAG96-1349, partial [uncultured Segetibacter sp.]